VRLNREGRREEDVDVEEVLELTAAPAAGELPGELHHVLGLTLRRDLFV